MIIRDFIFIKNDLNASNSILFRLEITLWVWLENYLKKNPSF